MCRSVFQAFCVSIFGPEFLHWRVNKATEESGEMDGGWWEERSEGYSLTEWRLMSLFCLTKPLLIPAGLWMFRDVSDMNNRCQSSAVTFDRGHSVVFGPALRAGTSSVLIQQRNSGLSFCRYGMRVSFYALLYFYLAVHLLNLLLWVCVYVGCSQGLWVT